MESKLCHINSFASSIQLCEDQHLVVFVFSEIRFHSIENKLTTHMILVFICYFLTFFFSSSLLSFFSFSSPLHVIYSFSFNSKLSQLSYVSVMRINLFVLFLFCPVL